MTTLDERIAKLRELERESKQIFNEDDKYKDYIAAQDNFCNAAPEMMQVIDELWAENKALQRQLEVARDFIEKCAGCFYGGSQDNYDAIVSDAIDILKALQTKSEDGNE